MGVVIEVITEMIVRKELYAIEQSDMGFWWGQYKSHTAVSNSLMLYRHTLKPDF